MYGFHTADCTPITMRQLESLIRLTEARAKLELREEATEGDAIDVVEIMRASMVDTAADPSMGANGSLVCDSSDIPLLKFLNFHSTYIEPLPRRYRTSREA